MAQSHGPWAESGLCPTENKKLSEVVSGSQCGQIVGKCSLTALSRTDWGSLRGTGSPGRRPLWGSWRAMVGYSAMGSTVGGGVGLGLLGGREGLWAGWAV